MTCHVPVSIIEGSNCMSKILYLLCAGVHPLFRILVINASSNLKTTWPGLECFLSRFIVSWAQHNHMSACEFIVLV